MVKIQENKVYFCEICEKKYQNPEEARQCSESHDIVYLPIERADLKRLAAFIYSGEPQLITQSLINLIIKYSSLKSE